MAKEINNWDDLIEYIKGMEIEDSIHIENSLGIFKIIKKENAPMKLPEHEMKFSGVFCPKCNEDMLRTRCVGKKSFKHCWNCGRYFTKDLKKELNEMGEELNLFGSQ